jgi:p-methyltransferase
MVYEQPEAMQDVLFRRMGADIYVCDAQGELALSRICAELREASPRLERVANLAFSRADKSFLRTRRQIEVNDLNESAMRWERFDRGVVAPTALVRTSRSCPNRCAFCRYPVLEGPHTLADLATVEKELDDLHSIGVTHIVFVDDTFNIPPDRFKDLCRMMIRKKYGFRWLSYFRCANADEEAFDLAAESGAMMLFLGIESGDQRILNAMDKNATVEQYHHGIQELKKRGIDTYASTMIGFPGETERTARNTMRFIEEAEPTFYSMEVYFHDTKVPVAERKEECGISGSGYSWRHDTMDWRDATELLKVGYRSIRGSSILPLHCFNVWSLGYYHSHGVARDWLREFVRLASRLCLAGLDDPPAPNQDAEDRILRVFGDGPRN